MAALGFHCNRLNHLEDRLLANSLERGEFYFYPHEDLPTLKRRIASYGFAASIHVPLVRSAWYPAPPTWSFLCDVEEERRQLTLRLVRETMEMAEDFGVEYVVVHYPSPQAEASAAAGYERERRAALASAEALAELIEKHQTPIHVEGFGPSPFLTSSFLAELCQRYPKLRYCFDTGHLHYTAQRDGFDFYAFAAEMAPYVGSLHLWNNRNLEDYLNYHHIPVHPSQRPEDGWGDVERILRTILPTNPACRVIFENPHWYPLALGNLDYREGVQWVKEILATLSSSASPCPASPPSDASSPSASATPS